MYTSPPAPNAAASHQPARTFKALGISSTATIAITMPDAACNAQFSSRGEGFQNSAIIPPAKFPAPGRSDKRKTCHSSLIDVAPSDLLLSHM
jgi:hypothetical protein